MKRSVGKKTEQLQKIINDHITKTGEDTFDMTKIAKKAIDEGVWKPPKYDPVRLLARELSRAAREEYYVDPQNREVRKKHCYAYKDSTGQYRWLWVDIITAKPDQFRLSAAARRRSSLGDVKQLRTDIDSYNDNNNFGAQIEMSFNYDLDLEEMNNPTEYPDEEEFDEDQDE